MFSISLGLCHDQGKQRRPEIQHIPLSLSLSLLPRIFEAQGFLYTLRVSKVPLEWTGPVKNFTKGHLGSNLIYMLFYSYTIFYFLMKSFFFSNNNHLLIHWEGGEDIHTHTHTHTFKQKPIITMTRPWPRG